MARELFEKLVITGWIQKWETCITPVRMIQSSISSSCIVLSRAWLMDACRHYSTASSQSLRATDVHWRSIKDNSMLLWVHHWVGGMVTLRVHVLGPRVRPQYLELTYQHLTREKRWRSGRREMSLWKFGRQQQAFRSTALFKSRSLKLQGTEPCVFVTKNRVPPAFFSLCPGSRS